MPYPRPTLAEIKKRRISDYEYELGAQNARLPGTIEYGLATSGSGTAHGLHGRIDQVAKNAFPWSADDAGTVKWAAFYGVFPNPAVRAAGEALIWGVNATVIPIGTEVTRSDGAEFVVISTPAKVDGVDAPNIIGDPHPGHAHVLIEAKVAGTAGNTKVGTQLSLKSPLGGVVGCEVHGSPGLHGGTDAESIISLRGRLFERLSKPPSGGGPGNYEAWAKQVSGVTRAWEYGKVPTPGHVTVLFMRDLDDDPFPGIGSVAAVETELLKYAPLHLAGLHVLAPQDLALSLEIQLTIEPNANLTSVRAAIIKSIQDMLATQAAPAAADGALLYRSWISEAISTTPGEKDHKLIVPAGDVVLAQWQLPTLDAANVTWPV